METSEVHAGICRCDLTRPVCEEEAAAPTCKRVYIAHPYNGITGSDDEKRANLEDTTRICQKLTKLNPYILPVSPLHAFGFMEGMSQQEIITCCYRLIDACDEVWVFGDWEASEGTVKEIFYALKARKWVDICKLPDLSDDLTSISITDMYDFCRLSTDLLFAAKIAQAELSERLDQTLRRFGAAEEAAHC